MIYITGSLNMDMTIEADRIPTEGETLTGRNFITNCGGKGANQAVAAAKLGGKVAMCGVVGNDCFGVTLKQNLAKYGVDVSHVATDNDVSCGIAVIVVSNGNNRIILDKGANGKLSKAQIDEFLSDAKAGDIYLTQLENPVDVVGYGLMAAKQKGMFTVLNPAPANTDVTKYLQYVDLIVPNETEAEMLGDKQFLLQSGAKRVVTTLGDKGYEIADNTGACVYPCKRVDVVDTTAAGDTMCGGIAVGLSEGMTLQQACAFGSLAATLACTRRGAQQSVPSRDEVEYFGK